MLKWITAVMITTLQMGSAFGALPRGEIRSVLDRYLEDQTLLREAGIQVDTPDTRAQIMKLVRAYRGGLSNQAARLPLKDAPFANFVILQRGRQIYADGARKAQLDAWTDLQTPAKWPVESIFDGMLEGMLNGTLPAETAEQVRALGACLARKALGARGASCPLDPRRSTAREFTTARGLHLRLDCGAFNTVSACTVRRDLFDGFKAQLHDTVRDPAVRNLVWGQLVQKFPAEYRTGFLNEIGNRILSLPSLVTQKFGGGTVDPLWDVRAPLIEPDSDQTPDRISMRGFAQGLRNDITAAAWLANAPEPSARAMAAPLFYAAANRLLVMTGESEAQWNGRTYDTTNAGGQVCESETPRGQTRMCVAPLQFVSREFGGWSLTPTPPSMRFMAWKWGGYDPTASVNPTPVSIFPEFLAIDARGRARLENGGQAVETLLDLAELIDALAEFLRFTRPDAVFGRFFGEESQMADVLDGTKPMLFPKDGRKVAVGTLAGVLKNLVVETKGHLELGQAGNPDAALGLIFHDRVTLAGRTGAPASIEGLARLLRSAGKLTTVLDGDPDVPAELLEYRSQLESALQVGSIILGAKGQEADGGFRAKLDVVQAQGRNLSDTVAALRALTQAHDRSRLLVIRVRIAQAWKFMDTMWGDRQIPYAVEGRGGEGLSPSLGWELMSLWDQTQTTVRQDVSEEDWSRWDARFNRLRELLQRQLRSPQGPVLLGNLAS